MNKLDLILLVGWNFVVVVLFQGKEVHSLQAIHESSGIKFVRRSDGKFMNLRYSKYQNVEVLLTSRKIFQAVSLQNVEVPSIVKETEVQIEVRAASLDPVDLKVIAFREMNLRQSCVLCVRKLIKTVHTLCD